MENAVITDIRTEPYFDLEDFMNVSKETRIEGPIMTALMESWQEWEQLLAVKKMEKGTNSWLAVWLPEKVEDEVDAAWRDTPSKGYLLNSLAQYMCMSAVQELLPQVAAGGCAPSPVPGASLRQALAQAGLDMHQGSGALNRRYAVLTNYPFKGGCEICSLRDSCPKGAGRGEEFASIVLPGHERGKD